jgi:KDO2-lipid IV(A) lauroyltransferase
VTAPPALLAYQAGSLLARALPEPVAQLSGRTVGFWLTVGMAGRRQVVERHLQRLHGRRMGPLELRREVHRTFDSYARYWLESFRLPAWDQPTSMRASWSRASSTSTPGSPPATA